MDKSDTPNVRIFRIKCSCGGGIGSKVCGYVRIKREREREREKKEKERISCFDKRFKEKGGLRLEGRKEGRKEGNEVREGREVRWTWMDGSGWMDIMGEHFRGTGGR